MATFARGSAWWTARVVVPEAGDLHCTRMACCEPSTSVFQEAAFVALEHMSYVELIRLSACSKRMRDSISRLLSSGARGIARRLLRCILQEAGVTGHDAQQPSQHSQAVMWLLRTADIPRATLEEDNYMDIPRVPASICGLLVEAGVRVTDERVISSARQGVQGVGNWVQEACKRRPVPTGLHPFVEMLYCPTSFQFEGQKQYDNTLLNLEARVAEDLLYVLVNSLPGDEPSYHVASLCHDLLEVSPAAQQMSVQSCIQLLQFWVKLEAERGPLSDFIGYRFVFMRLCNKPGMQQITGADIHNLISAAIMYRTVLLLDCILLLPAVEELTADDITNLLTTAIQSAPELSLFQMVEILVGRLCCAPAAITIPSDTWVKFLEVLLELQQSRSYVHCGPVLARLSPLPGMQQLDTAGVSRLLRKALQAGNRHQDECATYHLITAICHLPAASSIESVVLQKLLLLAAGLGESVRESLLQLPAAQQLPVASGQPLAA